MRNFKRGECFIVKQLISERSNIQATRSPSLQRPDREHVPEERPLASIPKPFRNR